MHIVSVGANIPVKDVVDYSDNVGNEVEIKNEKELEDDFDSEGARIFRSNLNHKIRVDRFNVSFLSKNFFDLIFSFIV